MKRKETQKRSFFSKSRRVLASTLAFAMIATSSTWAGLNGIFSTKIAADGDYIIGDVNNDSAVDLADTTIILKAALKLQELSAKEKKAADLTGDGQINMDDVTLSLKVSLKLEPVPTPTFAIGGKGSATPKPSATPKTTFAYVSPNALSVVTGEPLVVAEDSDTYNSSFIEDYKDNTGMYAFYDNKNNEEENGIKVDNPIARRRDLAETVVSATSLEAEPGKVNVWTLSRASLEVLPPGSVYPPDADPRITELYSPDEVTYTIPEWSTGLTVSFWAKVNQSNSNSDPVLTFTDGTRILSVRANGTVRFFDSSNAMNLYDMGSSRIDPLGKGGEWTYYTVTIANDWVQVYVNGQENVFDSVKFLRSATKDFNEGFLTRMNPVGLATKEMVEANERNSYYLTKIDATSTLLNQRAAWYLNPATGEYEGHDEFSVFYNARFRGANGQGMLLMKFLTQGSTEMFIGGAETSLDNNRGAYMFKEGAVFAGLEYFDKELTAEQVSSNYELVAKKNKPADVEYPGENPDKKDPTESQKPVVPVSGATLVTLAKDGLGSNATYDEETNTYTFKEPTANDDGVINGVNLTNPFAANRKLGDDKSYLKQTIKEALEGQEIFPYKYPDDYPDKTLAGQYVAKAKMGDGWAGHGGCDRYSVEPKQGNFYDKYYGDVFKYGTEITPPLANLEQGTVMDFEEVSNSSLEVTEFQRPVWTKGSTISFWAKPTVVDDSPIVTFYSPNKLLLSVDTMGSVCYMSLYAANDITRPNTGDWEDGKLFQANGKPRNTFATYGDASYVHANEWNYYTITFANDWVQVYVNGEEMVYKLVNLNRGETKYFNSGYLTRYNTIGVWTDKMVEKYGDPSGKTLEGKERNYLKKSGFVFDTTLGSWGIGKDGVGTNVAADAASIRANNVYEDPLAGHEGSELLMDLMTLSTSKLYLGGVDEALKAKNKFFFSTLAVSEEDIATGLIKANPKEYTKEPVIPAEDSGKVRIYVDKETTVAVDKDTPGAIKLEGVKDVDGNDVYVNEPCNVLEPVLVPGAPLPVGVYELGRYTNIETSYSRRKIYSSDHTLSEGTQVSDIETYYKELTAEEVKDLYDSKKDDARFSSSSEK